MGDLTTVTAVTQLPPKIRFEYARRASQMSESQSKMQTFLVLSLNYKPVNRAEMEIGRSDRKSALSWSGC